MTSRRRTSPKAEPLDLDRELDDMYSSAITRPNLRFLRVGEFPAEPAAVKDTAEVSAEEKKPTAKGSMDARSKDTISSEVISDFDRSSFATGDERSSDLKSIDRSSLDTVALDVVSMDILPGGKWKVHRCTTAQDGHNANEQLLYEMLWRSANPINADERLLAISREDMASQTRITVRNVKAVLDRLIEKLAIDRAIESNSFVRAAATYRVYSYRAILDRRRKAGLEWVTRANGVKFIGAETAQELVNRPKFIEVNSRQPTGTLTDRRSSVTQSMEPRSISATSVDRTSRDASSLSPRTTDVVPVPGDLGLRLRKINPAFDSAAVARLWRECRTRVPDCSVEEVLHFSNLTSRKVWLEENIRPSISLLLTSVPESFGSEILHEFREEKNRQLQEEARVSQENEIYWRGVLEDVSSTDADRFMAIKIIASSTKLVY